MSGGAGVIDVERLKVVTRAMVNAGLRVRQDPRMKFETDETRMIAEYRAMVDEALKSSERA